MKQAFVILLSIVATLLLSSGNSYGQKKDSLVSKWTDATKATRGNGLTITPKQDTIKVLMLVCDTSEATSYGKRSRVAGEIYLYEQRMIDGVWWQYGYEVCEFDFYLGGQRACIKIEYLDQNKKPLPSSIVVWMTKEIKN